jgi:hypothetical protein
MKLTLASMAAIFAMSACVQGPTVSPVENGLVGAWQLLSVETVASNGKVSYPFYGVHPQGLIIYDPSGWMSVQIVSDPKPNVPKADTRDGFRNAPPDERAAAADGYYAYFGTYSVDTKTSMVSHYLQESLFPGERNERVSRQYEIDGDRLILIARFREMGEEHQRRLTWVRLTGNVRTSPQPK